MKFTFPLALKTVVIAGIAASLFACNNAPQTPEETQKDASDSIKKENKQVDLKPTGAAPAWGTDMKPEMQVVIEKLASLGGKPIEKLDAKEAGMQPTPTDAVMAVM